LGTRGNQTSVRESHKSKLARSVRKKCKISRGGKTVRVIPVKLQGGKTKPCKKKAENHLDKLSDLSAGLMRYVSPTRLWPVHYLPEGERTRPGARKVDLKKTRKKYLSQLGGKEINSGPTFPRVW